MNTWDQLQDAMRHNRFNARVGASELHKLQGTDDIQYHIYQLKEACRIMDTLHWP